MYSKVNQLTYFNFSEMPSSQYNMRVGAEGRGYITGPGTEGGMNLITQKFGSFMWNKCLYAI